MHDLMTDFESVTADVWRANEEVWKEKLLKLPNWFQIPLINCNASHNLSDGALVRFRGMIQDMRNPEFYFEQFEVFNTNTNEVKTKSGKYRDTAHILENEKINYAQNLISSQRQTIVVVSLPGYNDWAQHLEYKENHLKHLEEQPNTSKRLSHTSTKLKRSYEDVDVDSDSMEVVDEMVTHKEPRTSELQQTSNCLVSREHLLNFPLPDVPSKSCIVKIYDESDNLKLNDMIEVVGFLSVDPALSGEFQQEMDPLLHPQVESELETITHNPPPSLIPRLHAVYVKKLQHCNPLLKDYNQVDVLRAAGGVRAHLLSSLCELLCGDVLCARYVLCHMLSHVYARHEGESPIGHLALNVSRSPHTQQWGRTLYDVITTLVTHSHYIQLTIDYLNTTALTPKKDYSCDRLTSGVLQLCDGTHLVIDETALDAGSLTPQGVHNVTSLADVINKQTVQYDFTYYTINYDMDIPVLVLSQGRSLLNIDCEIPLRAERDVRDSAARTLRPDVLHDVRRYITALKLVRYSVSEHTQQMVQDLFVSMRAECPSLSIEDLHRQLVLARLVSLSHGNDTLTRDGWDEARQMETERKARLTTSR